jgi:hypothetical protein
MPEENDRQRDIIIGPREYSYVQDTTKGEVNLYVGPVKISMSNTERLVRLDNNRRFVSAGQDGRTGVEGFVTAQSSQYVILENPTKDEKANYSRGPNSPVDLDIGKKVVVAGPKSFALWPGQKATVIDGHALREDEYVIVRAYENGSIELEGQKKEKVPIGTEYVVKGSETSFFVPPNGFEVVPENGRYVRKAYHLRSEQGLHVRVTKDFSVDKESNFKEYISEGNYKMGQELFISGQEGIFFPSECLSVVGEVSPIPLAENAGLYVMDKKTGKIRTEKGAKHFLPNPITEQVLQRSLEDNVRETYKNTNLEDMAVSVYVPPNHSIMVVSESGRKVVKGPCTHILDYTDTLEELALSTGTPKKDDRLLKTVYLQVEGNKVSDEVKVETKDHALLNLKVSYRLNFEGDKQKWFDVKNYVGLLCDHLSSILRSAVSRASLDEFYSNSTELLRNSVLGVKAEKQERTGRTFAENGMKVYDLEVLNISILDPTIGELLKKTQQDAFSNEMKKRSSERELEVSRTIERCQQELYGLKKETLEKKTEILSKEAGMALTQIQESLKQDKEKKIGTATNDVEAAKVAYELQKQKSAEEQERQIALMKAETEEYKNRMGAVTPNLIATLTRLGDQELLTKLSENLGQLSVLEGKSIQEIIQAAVKTLPYTAKALDSLKDTQ